MIVAVICLTLIAMGLILLVWSESLSVSLKFKAATLNTVRAAASILIIGSFVTGFFYAVPSWLSLPDDLAPVYETQEIYSLDSSTAQSGSFFLGTGSLHSIPMYYFYVEDEGGKRLETADARYIILYESEETPRERYFEEKCTPDKSTCIRTGHVTTKLYVPENTIKSSFDSFTGSE